MFVKKIFLKECLRVRKLEPAVKQETFYIACWVLIFSVLMQAVFLVLGMWELRTLIANLITGATAVVNFLLLGITVQNAVGKEPQEIRNKVKASQTFRSFGILLVVVIGYIALQIQGHIPLLIALVLPLLFPRIAIAIRPLFNKPNA